MFKNKIYHNICSVLFAMSLLSCEKIDDLLPKTPEEPIEIASTTYLIKEGQHSSTNMFFPLTGSRLVFKATFDSSAIYQTKNSSNQADINKLYGLSDCGSHHHQNSARFGWRWFNDQLEIHAYSYGSGIRSFKYITSVALNEELTYTLELTEQEYIFILNDKTVSMERTCPGTFSGYKLFPYFGGDETAPHDISIVIKDLPNTN